MRRYDKVVLAVILLLLLATCMMVARIADNRINPGNDPQTFMNGTIPGD